MRTRYWALVLGVGVACTAAGIVLLFTASSGDRAGLPWAGDTSGELGRDDLPRQAGHGQQVTGQGFVKRGDAGPDASVLSPSRPKDVQVAGEEENAPEPVAQAPQETSTSDRLIEEIKAGWDKKELTARARELMREFEAEGGDAVGLLVSLYERDGSVQERTVVINALKELGSQAAKDALLKLALNPGSDSATLGPRAAEAFAALTDDASGMAQLFGSVEPAVRLVAGSKLRGKPLTKEIVQTMRGLMESRDPDVHYMVGTVFGADPSPETASQKIALLLEGANRLGNLEDGNRLFARTGFTKSEMALGSYVDAMARMPGAKAALRNRLAGAGALQRKLIVMALALGKEAEARHELLGIIRSEPDGYTRKLGVYCLVPVATKDDLPLLRQLASSDPFAREAGGSHRGEGAATSWYPVREAAEEAVRFLESQP